MRLGGKARGIGDATASGTEDNDFYIAFNMDIHDVTVSIPQPSAGRKWFRMVDTSIENRTSALLDGQEELLATQERYVVLANSIVVLIAKD